ncbi:MAG: phosphotransferase [Gammaproteobacteria bacterium]
MAQSASGGLTVHSTIALDALATLDGWADRDTVVGAELGGSNTNRTWLVERSGERFVLRVDTPFAQRVGLDRQRESLIRQAVARAGLAPALIVDDSARGVTISEHKTGRTWNSDDLQDLENLRLLAARLQVLHELPPVGSAFSLRDAAASYALQLGDEASRQAAGEVATLLDGVHQRRLALCHNDLVAQNLIAGERLWLIDWEYAAVGDPMFDLAVVIEHHQLDDGLARSFLRLCLGTDRRSDFEDLARYRAIYRRIAALWRALV